VYRRFYYSPFGEIVNNAITTPSPCHSERSEESWGGAVSCLIQPHP